MPMQARRNDLDGELESEMEWSTRVGRWSWLKPCPEYCTNCGREADTIAERSPVASINKINWWDSPTHKHSPFVFIAVSQKGMETYSGEIKKGENSLLNIPLLLNKASSEASRLSGGVWCHCRLWEALACVTLRLSYCQTLQQTNKMEFNHLGSKRPSSFPLSFVFLTLDTQNMM